MSRTAARLNVSYLLSRTVRGTLLRILKHPLISPSPLRRTKALCTLARNGTRSGGCSSVPCNTAYTGRARIDSIFPTCATALVAPVIPTVSCAGTAAAFTDAVLRGRGGGGEEGRARLIWHTSDISGAKGSRIEIEIPELVITSRRLYVSRERYVQNVLEYR